MEFVGKYPKLSKIVHENLFQYWNSVSACSEPTYCKSHVRLFNFHYLHNVLDFCVHCFSNLSGQGCFMSVISNEGSFETNWTNYGENTKIKPIHHLNTWNLSLSASFVCKFLVFHIKIEFFWTLTVCIGTPVWTSR